MRKLLYLAVVILFAACNDETPDVNKTTTPTDAIIEAFNKEFPNAKNIEWSTSTGYYTAKFDCSASTTAPSSIQSIKAWYTLDGEQELIETEFENLNEIHNSIQTSVNTWLTDRLESHKQKFLVDDINRIERGDESETIYRVDVQNDINQSAQFDLFFNTEGILISEVFDFGGDENNYNYPIHTQFQTYINDNYTNIVILGTEIKIEETIVYDIEIIADSKKDELEKVEFELLFSYEYEYMQEEADLKFTQVPEELQNALKIIVPTASDVNIEIERTTLAGKEAIYEIDAEGDAKVLDGRDFKADGSEIK